MKNITITITDATAAELLTLPLSATARAELQQVLGTTPVVAQVVPQPQQQPAQTQVAASYDAAITAAALAHGFAKCIVRPWDWSKEFHITVDTAWLGGITPNGILVIPFVPNLPNDNDNTAIAFAIGYPAPNMMNMLTLCVSEEPCALYAPAPCSATDNSPTVVYGVGTVGRESWWSTTPSAVALVPGRQYYINVAGRDHVDASSPDGKPTALPGLLNYPQCDFRVEAQKPRGH